MGRFIFWDSDATESLIDSDYIGEADREIASEARDAGVPVWYDHDRDEAERLIIADEGYVTDIVQLGDVFFIDIAPYASAKMIKSSEAETFIETLRDSMENERMIIFAESEAFEILDVEIIENTDPLYEEKPEEPQQENLSSISEAKAKELFTKLASKSCKHDSARNGCVPYRYPRDGCWGRAHSMYQDIAAEGISSQKIWTYRSLTAKTDNSPKCRVWWSWHVATVVDVTGIGRVVIDPSLFDGIQSVESWLKIQRGRMSDTKFTSGRVFYRSRSGRVSYDKTFHKTKKVLDKYWMKLRKQARQHGWPPYAKCQT